MIPTVVDECAVLLAVVAWPASHGRGTRAKVTVPVSHTVARRAAAGTETVGFLKLAVFGLRAIGRPARAAALPAVIIALKVPATAHESYRSSVGRRRTL